MFQQKGSPSTVMVGSMKHVSLWHLQLEARTSLAGSRTSDAAVYLLLHLKRQAMEWTGYDLHIRVWTRRAPRLMLAKKEPLTDRYCRLYEA